jgi:SAM-dependent methyltransferase
MSKRRNGPQGPVVHPFDTQYGVETSGLIPGRRLAVGHPHDRHNTAYYGVAPSLFRELCRHWRESSPPYPVEEYSFIDLGAGKGRALMLASEMPFKEVIGVELNPRMAGRARRNLKAWTETGNARCPIRVVTQDAAEFPFPQNPCLVYLFNPFAAPVIRRILKRIEVGFADRPNQVDLLYVNHEFQSVLDDRRGFQRLWSATIEMEAEDAQAEKEIVHSEGEGEYTTSGNEECSVYRWVGKGGRKGAK